MNDNIINVLKLYLEQIKAENAIIFNNKKLKKTLYC
jgi:hypothetical protein